MALLSNWDIDFTGPSLSYVRQFATQLVGWAQQLGLPNSVVLATAGAIAREETANTQIYPNYRPGYQSQLQSNYNGLNNPYIPESAWEAAYSYLKAGGTVATLQAESELNAQLLYELSAAEEIGTDLATIGKLRVSTALDTLVAYQAAYGSSDPLAGITVTVHLIA
jgi:hypothetical protein